MSIVSSPTKATTETSNGENLPQLISPKTMAYIHSVLQERPLFLYFENDIESRFYAKRAEEYRRLVSVGKLIFFIWQKKALESKSVLHAQSAISKRTSHGKTK